jgi:hypothetical protein
MNVACDGQAGVDVKELGDALLGQGLCGRGRLRLMYAITRQLSRT